ncbi:MAG: NAD(P)-binding domain-containing protein [Ferruginibacter sp.]|nr:NAD(P)-binding domain-containing protein [Cytophagales bacterium]
MVSHSIPSICVISGPDYDAIIIGAGQAGLATGYYLQRQGKRFLILEGAATLGSSWRSRYDSLILFTPAHYSSLPGLPFPLSPNTCPTKDQVADYFTRYVDFHQLPVKLNHRVTRLSKTASQLASPLASPFEIQVSDGAGNAFLYRARNVIVATGSSQNPYVPHYDTGPDESVFQVHSSRYTRASALPDGNVLVVGAGNSGALLSVELATTPSRRTYLSTNGPLVFKPLRVLGKSIFWWGTKTGLFNLPTRSRLGRRLRAGGEGVYSDDLKRLVRAGKVRVVAEIERFSGREVFFRDGTAETFSSIVWATGYRSDYRWMDLAGALDSNGGPIHEAGVSPVGGAYFVGLSWQRTATSALILGAVRDARFIAGKMREREVAHPREPVSTDLP